MTHHSRVIGVFREGQPLVALDEDAPATVVLEITPFYAESGGQAGDRGRLVWEAGEFEVLDTQRQGTSLILHQGRLRAGRLEPGTEVEAEVDATSRAAVACNHSATHLLHAALRQILGDHVSQKGSQVTDQRLRFDFSHYEPMTREQLAAVERLVNEEIRRNERIEATVMARDDAMALGAMALFGEKYGEEVRVLRIGHFSTELCGGTHARRSGDLGLFKLTQETGVASGVRRIEAVTGAEALSWVEAGETLVSKLQERIKGSRDGLVDRLDHLLERNRQLEKELDRLKAKLASASGQDLVAAAIEVSGVRLIVARVDETDAKGLRELVDQLRQSLGQGVILLGGVSEGKVILIAAVTPDLVGRVRAGDLVNAVAVQVGGKGGGRPDLAQAGGSDPRALDSALSGVPAWLAAALEG